MKPEELIYPNRNRELRQSLLEYQRQPSFNKARNSNGSDTQPLSARAKNLLARISLEEVECRDLLHVLIMESEHLKPKHRMIESDEEEEEANPQWSYQNMNMHLK